jgi:hypothetical protein
MMHVVKGRQYSVCTVQCRMPVPQSRLRPTLDLDSDTFRCFNHHRDELDGAVQLPNFRSVGRGTLRYVGYI